LLVVDRAVGMEPFMEWSVGSQSRAVASVEGREFRGDKDGVGAAALCENEQLGRVGGAADHRDRLFASE
jgi:hypothetical protein